MPSNCCLSLRRYLPAVCIALSACTSSGRIHVTSTPARLAVYGTVRVQVSSEVDATRKEAIQLEATVAAIATEKLPFQQILTQRNAPGSSVDLRIEARIFRLEKVTVESRALNGVVAGRARVIADVMLIEEATGRVVARFTVEGQSSSAGTTEQAIKRASEQVVALMAARFNG